MFITDTDKQQKLFSSSKLGRVLQEEGIAADLNSVINGARRSLNLGVSDRIAVSIYAGDIVRWAIYWNRETLMKSTLTDRLVINGDNLTPPATSADLVTTDVDVTGAQPAPVYSRTPIGGSAFDFPVWLKITRIQ